MSDSTNEWQALWNSRKRRRYVLHMYCGHSDNSVYSGIRLIGLISTIIFIYSLLLLLCLSLPVGELENVPTP